MSVSKQLDNALRGHTEYFRFVGPTKDGASLRFNLPIAFSVAGMVNRQMYLELVLKEVK
jgi:hypothetical protein